MAGCSIKEVAGQAWNPAPAPSEGQGADFIGLEVLKILPLTNSARTRPGRTLSAPEIHPRSTSKLGLKPRFVRLSG